MSDSISFRLSPAMRKAFQKFCKRQKRPASEVAREAIRRYMAVEEFRRLRRESLPFAEASGILTDEDVFKQIS